MFQTKNRGGNQNTHFNISAFFQKSCRLWENVEKYCRSRQATDDNMAHAYCMLDNKGYKHTFRIRNTFCFLLQQWLHERASMLRYTFRVCRSVHLHTLKWINQLDAAINYRFIACHLNTSQQCFGHPYAHHQKPINCSSNLWFTVEAWW
jgi:hypothetical protein